MKFAQYTKTFAIRQVGIPEYTIELYCLSVCIRSHSTGERTNPEKAEHPESLFKVPAGYRETKKIRGFGSFSEN